MSSRHTRGAIFLALALGTPMTALALNETHVYGIASFGGTGQCGNTDMSHSVHTSTAAAFANYFNSLKTIGLWDEVSTRNNTSARASYWTDPARTSSTCLGGGSCLREDNQLDNGVDDADVIYVHTHGGRTTMAPWYTSLSMGSSASGQSCGARTDTNMLFGNPGGSGDLDIAVVKACQSGDYLVWKNGGYWSLRTSDSSFTMWNAFHGDSSCGSHVTSYVKDYVGDSGSDGVGENWLDEAYDWDLGSNNDDCPVSIVFGSSPSVRRNMFEWGGWRDRKDTGSKTGSTYFYISGCDPDNGVALP